MGCGGSKEQLTQQQVQSMKKQEQIAMQQQQQIKLQAEALETSRAQQEITSKQFDEQKVMLLKQQEQMVKQQQEALQMALVAKQQAEQAANSAAEQALKKAEEMKKRITPPAKPGKVNIIVQTDRTIPPNAIMKRRKPKDGREQREDHREECGGVGSDAVEAPQIAQIPVMVVREKDKTDDNDSQEDEYEYQYEYQYQYQYTDDMPAGPKAMLGGALGGGIPPPAIAPMVTSAPQQQLFTKEFAPPSRESSPGQSRKSSKRSSGPKEPTTNLKPGTVADDEDYEYEYDDEEIK